MITRIALLFVSVTTIRCAADPPAKIKLVSTEGKTIEAK